MRLFDIANRFKQPLNFNNNFFNISTKIQRQNKNVIEHNKDQGSLKSGWIQERVMLSVCQPTRNPAPLDLGHLVFDQRKPGSEKKTYRRNMIQENLIVFVCKPTRCPSQLDLDHFSESTNVKQFASCDLLGTGTFGPIPAVPLTTLEDERNVQLLGEGRQMRSSVLFEPGIFSPSLTPRQVHLNQQTLSIGNSSTESVTIPHPHLLPMIKTPESLASSNPPTEVFNAASVPSLDQCLLPAVESLTERPESNAIVLLNVPPSSLLATPSLAAVAPYSLPMVPAHLHHATQSQLESLRKASEGASSPAFIQADRRPVSEEVPPPASHSSAMGRFSGIIAAVPSAQTDGGRSAALESELMALISSPEGTSPVVAIQRDRRSLNGEVQPPGGHRMGGLHGVAEAVSSAHSAGGLSGALESQLMALISSPKGASPAAIQPHRRPLYGNVPPPASLNGAELAYLPFTSNRSQGVVYVYQQAHYNFRVLGQKIQTVDAVVDILNMADFLFQINPDTGIINVIGSGMFGAVFTATHLPSGNTVAIKSQFNPIEETEKIIAEARIMKLLETTRFVPELHGLLPNPADPQKLLIVMEMVGSGVTLRNKLDENTLNERQKLSIALRLAIGLYSIHLKQVLLNDLKDDNIIIYGSELQAKFIDFGHASCGFEKRYTGNTTMSIHLAPEVREGEPTTPSSDIFSLGYVFALFRMDKLANIVTLCKSPVPGQRPSLPVVVRMLMDLL